ncbi:radical SAM protein [Solwaraspora sp. WMMD937]|nr:radical SAM protein [Solwaraspora sp. WMMD937]WFE24586.1 radical SAM protein [Solwaraspora sp. WMMD937]
MPSSSATSSPGRSTEGCGVIIGAVHSYDVSIGVDGPGTRFVAFLAGCPLRCQFCHSPDTWFRRAGTPTADDALVAQVLRYQRFISVAGGGVTLSGGEPLTQPDFVRAVLRRCHDTGLHTALDTSGFPGARADDALLDATDLVLLDIKSSDPLTYRRVTRTGRLDPTLRFARRLAGHKYAELDVEFPLAATAPLDDALLDRVRGQFRDHGLTGYRPGRRRPRRPGGRPATPATSGTGGCRHASRRRPPT